MTRPDDRRDDAHLDAFFAAARADRPDPDAALLARVMADAADETARRAHLAAVRRPAAARRGPGILAVLTAALGGQGAVAGLAAAGLAGLWLGLAPPAPLQALSPALWGAGDAAAELIPDIDRVLAFAAEG